MNEVRIPAPHANQQPVVDSPARFKVVRAGRRFGKSRLALFGAVVGHGPLNGGEPQYAGIAQGVDIAWVAPDYPQSRAIWREEIEARFRGVRQAQLHQQERRLTLKGGGTLEIRSAEAVDGIRGRKLGGVVIDEAAYLDLEYAWKEVILPALMDLGGWALILSTPNAGKDGHQTADGPRTPSYFNMLCEALQAGALGHEWTHWHFTSRDNPKIPQGEVNALYREYAADSPELAQELDAKLIAAGAGVAFPEWRDDWHIAKYEPPQGWRWSAGMDWGYARKGWFGLFATGPERSLCRWEHVFRQTDPYTVGFNLGKRLMSYPRPEWISLDSAAFAVTQGGPTIAEEIQRGLRDACGDQAPPVIASPKGAGSRMAGKALVHRLLAPLTPPNEAGLLSPWGMPSLQVHPDCHDLIATLPKLPRDEKDPEDVDTDALDDAYDGLRYWAMARLPHVERHERSHQDPDKHDNAPHRKFRQRQRQTKEPRWSRQPTEVA